MKISQFFSFAILGWFGGALITLILGLLWPVIFPAVIRVDHYYGFGPGLLDIVVYALVFATPAALIGGLIGGRAPKEGGRREQLIAAMIVGGALAIPFGCYGMWVFTGW